VTDTEKKTPRIYKCPTCSRSTVYDVKNPDRPFCSSRCKNNDIISWAEQGYRIPGKPPQNEDEFMELQEEIERKGE
jgi:uncharacterized protein